jgi:hypothetical protein
MNFDQSLRHNRRAEDLSDFFNSIRRKRPLKSLSGVASKKAELDAVVR